MGSRSIPLRRITSAQNRLIGIMQLLFFVIGLVLMAASSTRIIIEFSTELFGVNREDFKEGVADWVTGDAFTSFPVFIISVFIFVIGYGLWWGLAALGAKEPPAWHAGRAGLIAILSLVVAGGSFSIWAGGRLLLYGLPLVALLGALALWILLRFSQPDFRLVLGAERLRRDGFRLVWIMYAFLVISGSTLIAVGLVYAVLTDVIELPLRDVSPGELLYMTTFDEYNDEWDTFEGKLQAQVAEDETGNNRLVLSMEFEQNELDGLFSTLDRKFRDFDLRLTAAQLESDAKHDNAVGIIFRYRSDEEYYIFEFSGDGWYQLRKVAPGGDTVISVWRLTTDQSGEELPYPTIVRPGSGNPISDPLDAMNEIRIIGRGDKFWFYVNGELLPLCLKGTRGSSMWVGDGCVDGNVFTYSYRDDDYRQGKIGLAVANTINSDASSPITIAFDNVVVLGPPSSITVPNVEAP